LLELATYGGLAKEPGRSWPAHAPHMRTHVQAGSKLRFETKRAEGEK